MDVRSGRRTTMVTRLRETGRMEGGLPSGVATSHDDDVVAGELARGGHRRTVEDTAADQRLDRLDAETPVVDAGGDQHRPGAYVAAVGVHDVGEILRGRGEAGGGPPGEEAGAEAQRLAAGALGQAHAGDAAREAEVVADHRAGAGLAPDGLGLETDRGEALARGVHAGREAGRPGAHDDEVDDPVDLDVVGSAVELVGQLTHAPAMAAPADQRRHHGPATLVLRAGRHHLPPHLAVGVVHARRHADPTEVVEQLPGQRILLRGDDADVLDDRGRDGGVPLVEHLADRAVELLVARALRHQEQGVDLARGDRGAEGLVVLAETADVRHDQSARRRHRLAGAADQRVERVLVVVGVDDEQGDLVTAGEQLLRGRPGGVLVVGESYVVLPLVAGEGLGQHVAVVGGGDDDRGRSHASSLVARGSAGQPVRLWR